MPQKSDIFSEFIQSQKSKTQFKIFEYIRKIYTNIRIYSRNKNSIFVFEYQIFGRKYSNIFEYSSRTDAFIDFNKKEAKVAEKSDENF